MTPFLILLTATIAQTAPFSPDVQRWISVDKPSPERKADALVWDYSANYSEYEWRVANVDGAVHAFLAGNEPSGARHPRLPFDPSVNVDKRSSGDSPVLSHAEDIVQVRDGWLVGFNHGEFGAAVYWFDSRGTHHEKVSDHQVVQFLETPRGLFAIEGLGHLGLSQGSVIRISTGPNGKWRAETVAKLPAAPGAALLLPNGSIRVVTDSGIHDVAPSGAVDDLCSFEIGTLYPGAIAAGLKDSVVYIGMRQFVAEVDVSNCATRWLIPDKTFLKVMPPDQEAIIRRQAEHYSP